MRTLTSLLLALTVSLPVNAQEPPERRGFWIGFGLGGGTHLTTALDDGIPAGFSGNFRLGGTLSPKWLLGAESAGWMRDVDLDVWAYRTNFTAIVLFYPSASGGLFLKAGPGVALLNETSSTTARIDGVDVTASVSAREIGFGGTFGVGTLSRSAGTCTWCRRDDLAAAGNSRGGRRTRRGGRSPAPTPSYCSRWG